MKKNIMKRILSMLVMFIFAILLMTIKSDAASLSISTSKSSVAPGGTFTVTVTVSGGAGNITTSVSNGSGGKTGFLDNGSYSFTCTAGSSGSVTISASGVVGDYATEKDQNKSASRTVQIVKPSSNSGGSSSGGSSNNNNLSGGNSSNSSGGNYGGGTTSNNSGGSTSKPNNNTTPAEKEKSKDSTLSALTVKEGAITPEFNKDIKEYALSIPYEISEVNVTATPNDSKATVAVEGNKELKEGENTVTVKVTAEDGSTSNYVIKVTRKRVPVALKSLVIKYENQEGELVEIPLAPAFGFDKLEYTLEDLEYWVEKLSIEAIPNIEGATVDIQGADNLQTGENTITITVKIKAEDAKDVKEGEEPKEETMTYTIKVNKKEEPTLMAKISNWFNYAFNNVSLWFNQNTEKVILGALGVCVVALIGLSVYIIVDHNRYKDVIAKAKMERKANKLNTNNTSENIIEEIHKGSNDIKKDNIDNNRNDKPKGGKHF